MDKEGCENDKSIDIFNKQVKELEKELKEALEKEKKLKKILIKNFKDFDEDSKLPISKKILKKIKKTIKEELEEWKLELEGGKNEEKELLGLITKNDWDTMKEKLSDLKEELGEGNENNAFFYFISNKMKFKFVKKIQEEFSYRKKYLENLAIDVTGKVEKLVK